MLKIHWMLRWCQSVTGFWCSSLSHLNTHVGPQGASAEVNPCTPKYLLNRIVSDILHFNLLVCDGSGFMPNLLLVPLHGMHPSKGLRQPPGSTERANSGLAYPEFTLSDPRFAHLGVDFHTAPFIRSHTTTCSVCLVMLRCVQAATRPFFNRPFHSVTRVDGTRAALPLTRVGMRQVEAITCTDPSRARQYLRVMDVNPTGGFPQCYHI